MQNPEFEAGYYAARVEGHTCEEKNGKPVIIINLLVLGHHKGRNEDPTDYSEMPPRPRRMYWTLTGDRVANGITIKGSRGWILENLEFLGYQGGSLHPARFVIDKSKVFIVQCNNTEFNGRWQDRWRFVLPSPEGPTQPEENAGTAYSRAASILGLEKSTVNQVSEGKPANGVLEEIPF